MTFHSSDTIQLDQLFALTKTAQTLRCLLCSDSRARPFVSRNLLHQKILQANQLPTTYLLAMVLYSALTHLLRAARLCATTVGYFRCVSLHRDLSTCRCCG